MSSSGLVGRAKSGVAEANDVVERTGWLSHAIRAYRQLSRTNGSLLANALTFSSFLALFPIILLVVAVLGYVLKNDQHLQNELFSKITDQVPGGFGDTLKMVIDNAIKQRAGIGIVGLAGFLLTGIGWVNNLRTATNQVWDNPPLKRSFLTAKVTDFVVLVGLGVALLVSLALTAGGTAFAGLVLGWTHLDDVPGAGTVTAILGIVIAIGADLFLFGFLLVRLPQKRVGRRLLLKSALLAAVGFELLKLGGSYYIKHVGSSPTYGGFGSIVGVLVWLNLVFRFLLYCAAWTATASDVRPLTPPEPLAPAPTFPLRPPAGPRGLGPLIALVLVALRTLRRLITRR